MPNFTAGPWIMRASDSPFYTTISGNRDAPSPWLEFARVVTRLDHRPHVDNPVGLANARLIRAAPEMYGVMRELVDGFIEGGVSLGPITGRMKALLDEIDGVPVIGPDGRVEGEGA